MNKHFIRYVGIGVLVIVAFVLFMSRTNTTYPYRAEIRSLQSENALSIELFVKAYRQYDTEGSYDLGTMEKQMAQLDWYIDRYESLEQLPDAALEDHGLLLAAIEEQHYYFQVIYETAIEGQPIPGEYALGLKKTIEALTLYENRMTRF